MSCWRSSVHAGFLTSQPGPETAEQGDYPQWEITSYAPGYGAVETYRIGILLPPAVEQGSGPVQTSALVEPVPETLGWSFLRPVVGPSKLPWSCGSLFRNPLSM